MGYRIRGGGGVVADRWPTLTARTGEIVLIREQRFAWMGPVTIETENNRDVLQQTSRPVTTNRSRIVAR